MQFVRGITKLADTYLSPEMSFVAPSNGLSKIRHSLIVSISGAVSIGGAFL